MISNRKLMRDRRNLSDPSESLQKRFEKDRFISAFIWMLIIELALSIGFGSLDLYDYKLLHNKIPFQDFLHNTLGNMFLCALATGLVVIVFGFFRLYQINKKPALKGYLIYKMGIVGSIALILVLFLAWILN